MFQLAGAAYLNRMEPWRTLLRSLALKGRRFDSWEKIADAVGNTRPECWRPQLPPPAWKR